MNDTPESRHLNGMKQIGNYGTTGEGWLAVVKEIRDNGVVRPYTDNPGDYFEVRECFDLCVAIENPRLDDPIIDAYKDPKEYEWMLANFKDTKRVEALHNANSYAERLYCYEGRKNQIEWVIGRLKENPEQRSCTITTFEPLSDEMYIPCVSLMDFQRRIGSDPVLDLNVYCRALDFGSKAYVNIVMLTGILHTVCGQLGVQPGKLEIIVKSAHYRTADEARIERMLMNRE